MGEVYLYHAVYGYILKMSPDILAFLDAFAEPIEPKEVCVKYALAFEDQPPEYFVGVFLQFGCLITPNHDQINDIWEMVPVKGRWNVWHRGKDKNVTIYAAWGERPVVRHALNAAETALWNDIDGEKTFDALSADHDDQVILDLTKRLADHSVQALKLSALPLAYYKGRQHMKPPYLTSTMPYADYNPATDPEPVTLDQLFTPEGYYRNDVHDANEQFDHQETTLSHLFRRNHPALKGRTYGAALVDGLAKKGLVPDEGGIRVLEIGAGLGFVAKAVTEALQARGLDVTYDILELSPALAEAQRERTAGLPVTITEGDVLSDPWPGTEYDLILSNEMIGDLTAIRLTKTALGYTEDGPPSDEVFEAALAKTGIAGELVQKYTVPIGDAPEDFYLNIGAWQLVEMVNGALAQGGTAVITEFGEMGRYPILSTHLDHPELSIHFGHLTVIARALGLETDFEFVMDLIDMARNYEGLSTTRSYYRAMQALLAEHDIQLEKVGYTKGMFKGLLGDKLRLVNIGEFYFEALEDRVMGLVPHEFKALILKKPVTLEA